MEYTEFEDMMASQIGEPMTADDLKFYFKKFDQNGDGFITSDELALVMKTFGGKSYSKKEIDDMIAEADTDSDGKVSYEGGLCLCFLFIVAGAGSSRFNLHDSPRHNHLKCTSGEWSGMISFFATRSLIFHILIHYASH